MKRIKLTRGQYALVDDADYEYLDQWKWQAFPNKDLGYYATTTMVVGGKTTSVRMHRLLMNPPKEMLVDHKNRITLDNQRVNLRICTHVENCRNRVGWRNSKSKYLGVSWNGYRDTWCATITVNRKRKYLGNFKTELEAAIITNIAMRKYYGEFARPNILTLNPSP